MTLRTHTYRNMPGKMLFADQVDDLPIRGVADGQIAYLADGESELKLCKFNLDTGAWLEYPSPAGRVHDCPACECKPEPIVVKACS